VKIRLVNESALGVYQMAWRSGPDQRRCVLMWERGLPAPLFSYYLPGDTEPAGHAVRAVPASLLSELGWAEPRPHHPGDYARFARAYAEHLETAWNEETTAREGENR